eukprot:3624928-Amphidinium_carterae.1
MDRTHREPESRADAIAVLLSVLWRVAFSFPLVRCSYGSGFHIRHSCASSNADPNGEEVRHSLELSLVLVILTNHLLHNPPSNK